MQQSPYYNVKQAILLYQTQFSIMRQALFRRLHKPGIWHKTDKYTFSDAFYVIT